MAGDLEERLRRMDGILRPIAALGRPSGCGMPGTVSAKPLSRLLQQVVLHLPAGTTNWQFVDIGAGSGRMLYAASICGASACCGVELCNLTHVFEAGLSRYALQWSYASTTAPALHDRMYIREGHGCISNLCKGAPAFIPAVS